MLLLQVVTNGKLNYATIFFTDLHVAEDDYYGNTVKLKKIRQGDAFRRVSQGIESFQDILMRWVTLVNAGYR